MFIITVPNRNSRIFNAIYPIVAIWEHEFKITEVILEFLLIYTCFIKIFNHNVLIVSTILKTIASNNSNHLGDI